MNNLDDLIAGFMILKNYESAYICAEHDKIHTSVDIESCPVDSVHGLALQDFGFHDEDGFWVRYV